MTDLTDKDYYERTCGVQHHEKRTTADGDEPMSPIEKLIFTLVTALIFYGVFLFFIH